MCSKYSSFRCSFTDRSVLPLFTCHTFQHFPAFSSIFQQPLSPSRVRQGVKLSNTCHGAAYVPCAALVADAGADEQRVPQPRRAHGAYIAPFIAVHHARVHVQIRVGGLRLLCVMAQAVALAVVLAGMSCRGVWRICSCGQDTPHYAIRRLTTVIYRFIISFTH